MTVAASEAGCEAPQNVTRPEERVGSQSDGKRKRKPDPPSSSTGPTPFVARDRTADPRDQRQTSSKKAKKDSSAAVAKVQAVLRPGWVSQLDKSNDRPSAVYYYHKEQKKSVWRQPLGHLFMATRSSVYCSGKMVDESAIIRKEVPPPANSDFTMLINGNQNFSLDRPPKNHLKSHPDLEASTFKPYLGKYEEVLLVIDTNSARGYGLQAMEGFAPGATIGFYHGDVIFRQEWKHFRKSEALSKPVRKAIALLDSAMDGIIPERLGWRKDSPHLLGFKRADDEVVMFNAERIGGVTRFINHSCNPNVAAAVVRLQYSVT